LVYSAYTRPLCLISTPFAGTGFFLKSLFNNEAHHLLRRYRNHPTTTLGPESPSGTRACCLETAAKGRDRPSPANFYACRSSSLRGLRSCPPNPSALRRDHTRTDYQATTTLVLQSEVNRLPPLSHRPQPRRSTHPSLAVAQCSSPARLQGTFQLERSRYRYRE
jgi:hypothetical protein